MGRNRISWDMEKAASLDKKADPYTMNQDHKNNPIEKYETYDTSKGKEDPDMSTPWKNEGRTETGHPAPVKGAREAVLSAKVMEDKALKCITIAQRMLPGASDGLIEDQATDLMYLPEHSVLATLSRQSRLAEVLASGAECKDEDADAEAAKAKKDEEVVDTEAAKAKKDEEEAVPPAKEEVEAKKADPKEVVPPAPEKEEVEAKKADPKEVVPPAPEKEEVEAKKADPKEVVPPAPEKEEVEASNGDLLDMIFAQEETKTGAKKLSGIVKQASSESNLDNLWDAPPDVSKAFR